MNPLIEELEDILDQILRGVQDALQNGEVLSEEFQLQVAEEITNLTQEIDQLYQEQNNPQQPESEPQGQEPFQGQPQSNEPPIQGLGAPPSPDAQLLWILAGQQEDAFVQYLHNFPAAGTQHLLTNSSELERVIQYLHQMMPSGAPPTQDGIQHSHLNSSNIWGTNYNPGSKKMRVRFQGGSVYEYDNIPVNIYRAFTNGEASAKTDGQNQYGRWWKNKNPSLGAAMNHYIKQGGYNYRRLR